MGGKEVKGDGKRRRMTKEANTNGAVPRIWTLMFLVVLTTTILLLSGQWLYRRRKEIVNRNVNGNHEGYRVGVEYVDITPTVSLPQAGFSSRTSSADEGPPLHFLRLTAVSITKGKASIYILSYDLIGADRSLADKIYKRLEDDLGIRRHEALLLFSHTHSGPIVGKNLQVLHEVNNEDDRQQLNRYEDFLVEASVNVVRTALNHGEDECSLSFGHGWSTLGVNRRWNVERDFRWNDDTGQWERPDVVQGPIDEEVSVLTVWRKNASSVKTVLFGYAAHGTVLTTELRYSNDWIGFARNNIEESLTDAVAVFVPGCGGDINIYPRGDVALAKEHGAALAMTVVESVRSQNKQKGGGQSHLLKGNGQLRCLHTTVNLAYDRLTHDQKSIQRILARRKRENKYTVRLAQLLMNRREQLPPDFFRSYPYPLTVCGIGPSLKLIALGGEVVSEYSLRLKAEEALKNDDLFVAAYAGDVMGYVPSRRVVMEGGYEAGERSATLYGLPGVWGAGIEDIIIAEVIRMRNIVHDGLSPDAVKSEI